MMGTIHKATPEPKMTKQISEHAAAAKLIRAELKKNGIKATVRASSASMTSSVNVTIEQDLLPAAVKEIEAYCGQYQYGHFDGMTDCYEYSNRQDLPQVKFVFVTVAYSDELKAEVAAYVAEIGGIDEWEQDRYRGLVIHGSWGDFWSSKKPRVNAA